jgi:SAF domain
MVTTSTRARSVRPRTIDPPRFAGGGHGRRPAVALASLALLTFCVAIFTSLYVHAGDRVAVLATARAIPQGHAITSSDLVVVNVSLSPGLSTVLAHDLAQVLGRRAAVPLLPGTLLSRSALAVHGISTSGQEVVGVATKAGQLPAGGVAEGDRVDVILTGSPATLAAGTSNGVAPANGSASNGQLQIGAVLAPGATVTGVEAPNSSSPDTTVVSVLIPSTLAPLVASASAAGQAALALVGPSA